MNRKNLENFIRNLNVEEITHYYIENGFEKTCEHYNLSHGNFSYIRKLFQIKIPAEITRQRKYVTNIERFGEGNYSNRNKIKERFKLNVTKEELIDLYITQNLSQNEICDVLHTNKNRLKDALSLYDIVKPKELIYQAREAKTQITNLDRYGVTHYAKCEEGKEKQKQTMLDRYKVEYFAQSEQYKNLYKDEDFKTRVQNKRDETKRVNKTFKTSKKEEEYFEILKYLYEGKQILRNYKCEQYPFKCDFYIPSEDLFIELNAHWTHGGKPYDPEDKECQEKLAIWQEKAKTSQFYANAIKTWTERDVEKQRVAKENNLNYFVIYN